MTGRQIISQMIERVANEGYDSNPQDVAIKLWFYGGPSTLLTETQWKNWMKNDDEPHPRRLKLIINEVGRQLKKIMEEVAVGSPDERGTGEQNLSVVMYGLGKETYVYGIAKEEEGWEVSVSVLSDHRVIE